MSFQAWVPEREPENQKALEGQGQGEREKDPQ